VSKDLDMMPSKIHSNTNIDRQNNDTCKTISLDFLEAQKLGDMGMKVDMRNPNRDIGDFDMENHNILSRL